MNNPHDKFFKDSLGHLEIAKGFLKNYLPQNLIELINLNNIVIDKNSFIDKELEEVFSDLLYKVDLAGTEAYLYFLFEHKSYPYPQITVQLLKYMTKIWELKIKQTEANNLPLIIPLVIYHGKRKWDIGLKLSEIVKKVSEERSEEVMTIAEELKKEGREEVAKNLLKMGMDIHQISEATELNEEQIKELKRKSQH